MKIRNFRFWRKHNVEVTQYSEIFEDEEHPKWMKMLKWKQWNVNWVGNDAEGKLFMEVFWNGL